MDQAIQNVPHPLRQIIRLPVDRLVGRRNAVTHRVEAGMVENEKHVTALQVRPHVNRALRQSVGAGQPLAPVRVPALGEPLEDQFPADLHHPQPALTQGGLWRHSHRPRSDKSRRPHLRPRRSHLQFHRSSGPPSGSVFNGPPATNRLDCRAAPMVRAASWLSGKMTARPGTFASWMMRVLEPFGPWATWIWAASIVICMSGPRLLRRETLVQPVVVNFRAGEVRVQLGNLFPDPSPPLLAALHPV